MPEWLETTRTSRMELIGVVKVPDFQGKVALPGDADERADHDVY